MKAFRWVSNSILSFVSNHILIYPTPSNLSYAWSFGSLAGLFLVIQILTGVFLAMYYVPQIDFAFMSVEHIMRNVNNGWLIRYMHANGASIFFLVVYFHIFRGIYYGSFLNPRQDLWCSGVVIFILMMATAFMGYVLPWGQMSFWGATVITNLFSAVPVFGGIIVDWLWGGFSVDQPTLNRFFSLHFLLPFLIVGLVIIHLCLLHKHGSNNPVGVNNNIVTVPFYSFFYKKDFFSFWVLILFYLYLVFFDPNLLGHPDNYIPADPMVTPAHIVPEWYFLPFYAILRSIPNKLGGVIAMFGALICWLIIPFINTSMLRSNDFRPINGFIFWTVFGNFLLLGWIGQQPVEYPYMEIGMLCTFYYFFSFLFLIPLMGFIIDFNLFLEYSQMVRQTFLNRCIEGSNPSIPMNF